MYYSYFTCGAANSFDKWFGDNSDGSHSLTELVTLMEGYSQSISGALEDNFHEVASATSACSPPPACPCTDCVTVGTDDALAPSEWDPAGAPEWSKKMTLATATYKQRPGTSTTSSDAIADRRACVACRVDKRAKLQHKNVRLRRRLWRRLRPA